MIPVPELRDYLRLDHLEDDYLLEQVERAAVAYVERETGRYFGPREEGTEHLAGTGTSALWLADEPAGPVEVVNSYDWPVVDFTVHGRRLHRVAGWATTSCYAVTYERGYEEGEEPADVRLAVMQLVALMYEYRSPVLAGETASRAHEIVADVIRLWRRRTL